MAEIEGYQKVIDGARAVLDNYRPHIPIHPDWPKRQLGSLAENLDSRRVPITKGDRKEGPFPYYGASGIVDYVADYIFDEDILLISEDGANLLARSTPIAFSVSGKCWVNNHAHVLKFENPATQKFVEVYLNSISIEEFVTGAAQPKLNQQALNSIPIPIPDDCRHAASHRRRDRSRAGAGRRQPRTDRPLREEDPGHPRPRLGRGRAGPGGGVSHGRSRRTGQLPAALLQEPEASRSTSPSCGTPSRPTTRTASTSSPSSPTTCSR